MGTVDVSGVDEGDSSRDDVAQKRDATVSVWVVAPDLGPGELHRAEADATDREIATDRHRGQWFVVDAVLAGHDGRLSGLMLSEDGHLGWRLC